VPPDESTFGVIPDALKPVNRLAAGRITEPVHMNEVDSNQNRFQNPEIEHLTDGKIVSTPSNSLFDTLNTFLAGVVASRSKISSPPDPFKQSSKPVSQVISEDDFSLSKESKDASRTMIRFDDKGRTVLPLANGRFSLDTLSVYTPKNSTFLKPEKTTVYNKNANFIKVNIL